MTLPRSKNILLYPARYQFQAGAPCNGSTTCTDTCIQMIAEYYKDKTYSLGYIRKVAQAKTHFDERPCTGINYVEAINALNALGVTHYKVGWGINSTFIAQKAAVGPVIVGVWYGNYPRWSGHCTGTIAEKAGRTQCASFTHAVLAIGSSVHRNAAGARLHTDILVRDPNHHSPSRREAPPYDRYSLAALNSTMLALPRDSAFSKTYCIYPTRKK